MLTWPWSARGDCRRAPTVAATRCLRAPPPCSARKRLSRAPRRAPGAAGKHPPSWPRSASVRRQEEAGPSAASSLRALTSSALRTASSWRTRTRRARGQGRVVGERPLPAAKLCLRTLPGGGQAELRIELKVELRVEPPCAAVLRVEDCVELEDEESSRSRTSHRRASRCRHAPRRRRALHPHYAPRVGRAPR